jgi:dCMP deaminase
MNRKFINYFMDVAERTSRLSYAVRLKVGAIIVKDDRIISIGYNGMPSGWDNNCEFEYKNPQTQITELVTRKEVLHAETNAIAKLAKSNESGIGATLFITHAPCLDCAKLIYQSGINNVIYRNTYRIDDGINFLNKSGVNVTQYAIQD